MYHIFIPYLAEGAQGNELGYAVAGWSRDLDNLLMKHYDL